MVLEIYLMHMIHYYICHCYWEVACCYFPVFHYTTPKLWLLCLLCLGGTL